VVENLKESDESLFSYTGSDDVLENRAGYYVALLLMRRVLKTQKLSVNDLFLIGRQKFFEVVKALLENQPAQHRPGNGLIRSPSKNNGRAIMRCCP